LVASAVGLGLGVAAAIGLKALLKAFGIVLPSSPLVFELRTAVVALAAGVGVTVLSAILPARRAVAIAPVAALAGPGEQRSGSLRRRVTAGVAIAAAAVAAVLVGLAKPSTVLVGIGALAVFVAAGLLVPLLARPLSSAIGRPLAALRGVPGKLGRENAMRNPRRTAQTAAALMIGLALVSTIAVLGASLSRSAKQQVDSALSADYIVSGNGGFSKSVAPTVARLPGVATTTTVYQGQFEFRGSLSTLAAATAAHLDRTVTLHVTAGSGAPALAAGRLLIDTTTADKDHLHVGSTVPVRFARTGSTTTTIGGIFKPNPLVGSFVVSGRYFLSHFDNPLPSAVLISTGPGAGRLSAALNRALQPYANVGFKTRTQFEHAQEHAINQQLGLVYVLLALAVVVALIGIVNTLMLSVFERTREIGLLRAVGMGRRQVRAMIRSESVIIALFGAVVGIVIGTGLGLALASSLRHNGVTSIAVPFGSLIGFLVLAALLGLAAGSWPARRAARLDLLAAIASE
jgi:putative ABC transport system permease protein